MFERLKSAVAPVAPVMHWAADESEGAYLKRFLANEHENLFWGSFDSMEAAQAHVPQGLTVGYESAGQAPAMYSHQLCSWDYASLFWVADAMQQGRHAIFDLGGHVGIKYYAFRRVVPYPEDLHWTVCDVPRVAQAGEALARDRGVNGQLAFCTDWHRAAGADVLLLSGSLQYLPQRMAQMLAALEPRPWRVLLNITAGHADRTMYTLNSIGRAVCPYRIQLQDEVLEEIHAAGYRRRDVWHNDDKKITVPFVEGGDRAFYFGCCFDRQ